MALINCPQCGKQVSDKAPRCPHCGLDMTVPYQPPQPQPQKTEAPPKKPRKVWLIVAAVAGVVIIVAIALWFFVFNNTKTNETPIVETARESTAFPYKTSFTGTIGSRGSMYIDGLGGGSYTYDNNGTSLTRSIKVKSYDNATGHLLIESYGNNGVYIGLFDGYTRNNNSYTGTFTNYKGGTVEFRLFTESESDYATYSAFEYLMKKDASSYLFTKSDLSSLSPKELSYLRNQIYAKHGYVFKSQELKDYFNQFSWYHPNLSVTGQELNSTEKANAEFIKRYQDENGKNYQLDERKDAKSYVRYVVIDGTELRLRLGPSKSADTFKWGDGTNRHPKVGEKFKYLSESGDFYQIDFHGHHLWVSKYYTHIE